MYYYLFMCKVLPIFIQQFDKHVQGRTRTSVSRQHQDWDSSKHPAGIYFRNLHFYVCHQLKDIDILGTILSISKQSLVVISTN